MSGKICIFTFGVNCPFKGNGTVPSDSKQLLVVMKTLKINEIMKINLAYCNGVDALFWIPLDTLFLPLQATSGHDLHVVLATLP